VDQAERGRSSRVKIGPEAGTENGVPDTDPTFVTEAILNE